ncbi:hypothetical protein EDD15DRAFT_2198825 [Pisolithus albus]|nr:hypothetical protein EDD15DRAFT_2198825 [Pisolithus albus]
MPDITCCSSFVAVDCVDTTTVEKSRCRKCRGCRPGRLPLKYLWILILLRMSAMAMNPVMYLVPSLGIYRTTSRSKFDVSTVLRVPSSDSSPTCRRTTSRTPGSKFDVSTTVEPPSSDYVNLAGVTLHATSSSTCPRYYVPLPLTQVRRADELHRACPSHVTCHFEFDVSTLLCAPCSDYVSLAGVPLDATSRAPSKSDVSTTVEPPSSDYVGLTGIPLDATSW